MKFLMIFRTGLSNEKYQGNTIKLRVQSSNFIANITCQYQKNIMIYGEKSALREGSANFTPNILCLKKYLKLARVSTALRSSILLKLIRIFSRDLHQLLGQKLLHFPFRLSAPNVVNLLDSPGEMKKSSTKENVISREKK